MPLFCNCNNNRYNRYNRRECEFEDNEILNNIVENTANEAYSSICCCDFDNKRKCKRCGNLVRDPSFEWQSFEWNGANVSYSNNSAFEGAIQAVLGPGTASLAQNVFIRDICDVPLFFSFNAYGNIESAEPIYPGILIAEISWLDDDQYTIGLGLRMVVPYERLNTTARITFFAQTDVVPANASYAKIVFTKGQGAAETGDFIYIDNVILAPMAYQNLIRNGGFEANLLNWTSIPATDDSFISAYRESLVDAGHAHTQFNSTLTQDISIRHLPHRNPFLLSFAVQGEGPVSLAVRVDWINQSGNTIGNGLVATIPIDTFDNQGNYLTYLFVTTPPAPYTAFARVTFQATVPSTADVIRLDQVIFAPIITPNLVLNPGFEEGETRWNSSLVNFFTNTTDAYVGTSYAGIGQIGGALWQDIDLVCPEGQCFLFSAGAGFRNNAEESYFGTTIMKVIWLDRYDREISTGLTLISSVNEEVDIYQGLTWVPFVGITEPAPEGTAKARILISKTDSVEGYIQIDNVIFARLF